MTLWHGRLGGSMAPELAALSVSIAYDQQLALVDIAASHAHVDGLVRGGIVSSKEGETLHEALGLVGEEFSGGSFEILPTDEDIHTAVERRVTELCGDIGAKLHTGRSRNDADSGNMP